MTGAVAQTMRREAQHMTTLTHERLVVVDRAGRVLHTTEGNNYKGGGGTADKRHVAEAGLNAQIRGNFEMHNHHDGLFATFSLGDIVVTAQAHSLGTRVVSHDRTVTMMPRTDGTWPTPSEIRSAYHAADAGQYHALLSAARAGRMSDAVYNVRAENHLRAVWRAVAAQTGMRYVESPTLMPQATGRGRRGGNR
jgi:hypothetical protein